jgi:hypothetical protein
MGHVASVVALVDGNLSSASPALSPAAERMRRHRKRRLRGLHCLTIEVRETEIEELIRRGMLARDRQHDRSSLRKALYAFLDNALGSAA